MNCRTCNYSLWNLVARQCPECGSAFKPSEFEFTPGSVRFLCPHCEKAYYGTAQTGHLVPRSFTCVGCARPIDMDEMSLLPAHGIRDAETVPVELPWMVRKDRGRLRSFCRTIWWGLIRPTDVGRAIPAEGDALAAWIFMFLVQLLVLSIQIGCFFIIPLLAGPGGMGLGILISYAVTVLVFAAVIALICVPLWAGVAHMILRGSGSTRAGFRVTLASICFSAGANLPTAVPFFGYLFGPVWWLISATVTTKEAQRVGGGRAALAILPMPIIGAGMFVAAYISLIGWLMSMAGPGGTFTVNTGGGVQQTLGISQVATVASAVRTAALDTPDATPPHPLQLLADGAFHAQDLIAPGSRTDPDTWTISGIALSDIPFLTSDQLRQLQDRLAQRAPASGAGEFRLGDAVFITDRVNIQTANRALWIVILWPDPVANPVEDATWYVGAASADGSTTVLSPSSLDTALTSQNLIRAGAGLPPIRHPREVR